ncbi:hypothetical protein SAMN05660916_00605 [Arthrobacter sp. 31Cvi3.1E]|nr:hypothetical protein SAMN05660916_00605 [Arthrobacter sp. 31Cvi3.1E]
MTTGPALTRATPGSPERAEIAGARRDRRSSSRSPLLSSGPAWFPRFRRRNALGAKPQVLLVAMSVQLDLDDHGLGADQGHAVAAVARDRRSASRSPLLSSGPAWLPRSRRRSALGAQRQVLLVAMFVQLDLVYHWPGTDQAHAVAAVARVRWSGPRSPFLVEFAVAIQRSCMAPAISTPERPRRPASASSGGHVRPDGPR